jgi:predicted nucleotidyltransferase
MLLKVATEFYKNTELTAPIEDIYFLGSSAGYNWTPTSDMDLHVLIDFKLVDPNKELVKKLVDGYKNKWNEDHDIHYNEHPVEVYIQDVDDVNRSQAVYSVLNNHWVKKPHHENIQIDKPAIKAKYKQLVQQIDTAITSKNLNDLKDTVKRLYNMREAGLSTGGEYSTENIVFKLLRSSGYISKLRTNINSLTDTDLNKV